MGNVDELIQAQVLAVRAACEQITSNALKLLMIGPAGTKSRGRLGKPTSRSPGELRSRIRRIPAVDKSALDRNPNAGLSAIRSR